MEVDTEVGDIATIANANTTPTDALAMLVAGGGKSSREKRRAGHRQMNPDWGFLSDDQAAKKKQKSSCKHCLLEVNHEEDEDG